MFKIVVLIIAIYLFSVNSITGQLIINEIQSSNVQTVKDEFNEFPDWIEILNNSASPVDLTGWHLSDDTSMIDKWAFPDYTLQPNQYFLVFASGRDLANIPIYWSTVIDMGDEFNYIVPTSTLADDWKSNGFDVSGLWQTGKSGFGYSDGDDSTIISNPVTSVYIRKEFTIPDVSKISRILLHVDYDDGFVAYINGVEVARSDNMVSSGSPVSYDHFTDYDHEAQMYSGGQPEQFEITSSIGALQTGTNTFAIEVHNVSTTSSDMSLIPFLTFGKTAYDSPGEKPSSYLVLGNSAPHTNFKLKSDGETVILSNSSGVIVDSLAAVPIPPDYSYGKVYGILEYGYFLSPTPGSPNGAMGYSIFNNDSIIFSQNGGYFTGTINVSLTAASGDPVYYTTDGTDPDAGSLVYSSPISISSNTVIRARVIKTGFLPGTINTRTYYNDHQSDLPVICLSTDPYNLWDYNNGMYVLGPSAENDVPHFGANFWMDWEKPMNIELYDKNGNTVFNQLGGAKIFGAWSRAREQKSFALFARKNYGKSRFSAKIFKQRDLDKFKSIVIRNGGNDWDIAMFRDAFMTDLTSHLGIDHQAFQPVSAYLNGEYWGIYNIREKVNEDFLSAHHEIDADDINMLENDGVIIEGSDTTYLKLRDFLNQNASLASTENYSYVADLIDVDEYIKYQLVEIYVDNTDWPGNNLKYWNTIYPGSKFRWIIYDTDFGFGEYNELSYEANTLDFALEENGPAWPNPPWSTLLFRRLVTNTGFRHNFINQFADNINTTFLPSNINTHVDSIKNIVSSEMTYQTSRWGLSYDNWSYQIDRLKTWGQLRLSNIRNHIQATFNLAAQHNITLSVSDESHGYIRLNSIKPRDYPFSGVYFEDVPVEMEAIPAPGYKFSHWEGDNTTTNRIISYHPQKNASFKAVFEVANVGDIDLVINEINYNSPPGNSPGDWVEIYNNGNATVDISGFYFRDANPDSGYTIPEGTILEAGAYLVITKNGDNFKAVHPDVDRIIGDFDFGLSSSGDEIRLYDKEGAVLDAVDYLPYAPWPIEANGMGPTLELISPDLDNGQPQNWTAKKNGGTPGRINSGISVVSDVYESIAQELSVFPTRFSDYTTAEFYLEAKSFVKFEIIDMQGRVVETMISDYLAPGYYSKNWTPDNKIQNGMYIIRLTSEKGIQIKKVIYIN